MKKQPRICHPYLRQLFNEQSGLCVYCGQAMCLERDLPHSITRDHLNAVVKGGVDTDNIVGACDTCNNRKGGKSLVMFLLETRRRKDLFHQ